MCLAHEHEFEQMKFKYIWSAVNAWIHYVNSFPFPFLFILVEFLLFLFDFLLCHISNVIVLFRKYQFVFQFVSFSYPFLLALRNRCTEYNTHVICFELRLYGHKRGRSWNKTEFLLKLWHICVVLMWNFHSRRDFLSSTRLECTQMSKAKHRAVFSSWLVIYVMYTKTQWTEQSHWLFLLSFQMNLMRYSRDKYFVRCLFPLWIYSIRYE